MKKTMILMAIIFIGVIIPIVTNQGNIPVSLLPLIIIYLTISVAIIVIAVVIAGIIVLVLTKQWNIN